jgi:hypothetical protein
VARPPDQAALDRGSPLTTPADVWLCYNIQVLETWLCSALEGHFALRDDRKLVEAVSARHTVQVSVDRHAVQEARRVRAVGTAWRAGGAGGLGTTGRRCAPP